MTVGGLKYDKTLGLVGGNAIGEMMLVSAGCEYPADMVVSQRIKSPFLADKARKLFGSLPSIVPGLPEEAAADLMAFASTDMRSSNLSAVHLLLDLPFMQRSRQFYIKKIEEFLLNCQEPVGMSVQYVYDQF